MPKVPIRRIVSKAPSIASIASKGKKASKPPIPLGKRSKAILGPSRGITLKGGITGKSPKAKSVSHLCVACGGTGVSSKKGRCIPCKGTGFKQNV